MSVVGSLVSTGSAAPGECSTRGIEIESKQGKRRAKYRPPDPSKAWPAVGVPAFLTMSLQTLPPQSSPILTPISTPILTLDSNLDSMEAAAIDALPSTDTTDDSQSETDGMESLVQELTAVFDV